MQGSEHSASRELLDHRHTRRVGLSDPEQTWACCVSHRNSITFSLEKGHSQMSQAKSLGKTAKDSLTSSGPKPKPSMQNIFYLGRFLGAAKASPFFSWHPVIHIPLKYSSFPRTCMFLRSDNPRPGTSLHLGVFLHSFTC